jgi:tetratricopeptide (TPR) repeat protein
MTCVKQAYDDANKNKHRTNQCAWSGSIGEIHLEQGQYDEAREWLSKALSMALEMNDLETEGQVRGLLGRMFLEKGEYEEARTYLEEALRMAQEINDKVSELAHHRCLGRLYATLDEKDKAKMHFSRAYEMAAILEQTAELTQALKNEMAHYLVSTPDAT